jgi:hypothetical protein
MQVYRKRIIQVIAILLFMVGAILIGVGAPGENTSLIVTGIICLLSGGAAGFMGAMEPRPLLPISATPSAASA